MAGVVPFASLKEKGPLYGGLHNSLGFFLVFGEIERLRTFIECSRRRSCQVFVIDELFSCSNTIERIAIARAVLEQLSTDAQVLVTTHDVELQQHLFEVYDLYHFQENPDIEGFFDYKLTPGAAVERNALRLLGRVGFPGQVVTCAMDLLAGQSTGASSHDDSLLL